MTINKFKIGLTIILIMISFIINAQNKKISKLESNRKIDYLKLELNKTKCDTTRLRLLNAMVNIEKDKKLNTIYNEQLESLANKTLAVKSSLLIKNTCKKYLANAINRKGVNCYFSGDYAQSLEYYNKCLKIREDLITTLNVIANKEKNYGKKSVVMQDAKKDVAASLNNIGTIYSEQGDIPKALEYYNKSLKIKEELNDKSGISKSLNNIGIIYRDQNNITKALEYYNKSLKIKEELDDKSGISASLNNIGAIYSDQANEAFSRQDILGSDTLIKKALEYFKKSLKIREVIADKSGISGSLNNIGSIYLKTNQIVKAFECANRAYNLGNEIDFVERIRDAAKLLEEIYTKQGNYKLSRKYFGEYITMRDSIAKDETQKLIQKKYFQYLYEKKAATDSIAHSKALEISNLEISKQKTESRKQKIVIGFIVCSLFLIIVIAVIILRSLRITRRQKDIIVTQKKIVDEKNLQLNYQNEEIATQRDLVTKKKEQIEQIHEEQTDSIRYAERIQKAVLPRDQYIKERIPGEFFILFKPRDIVSGDFYFVEKRKNWILITVADCTGHGVPGAFMSMLGISFLNEIIAKEEIQSASHVLDELRQYVIHSLQQKGVQGEQQDGMDISFLALNTETSTIEYAGANNPLYIIPNESNEIVIIKADAMPVGIYGDMQPFKNNSIKVNKGDKLYIFSDGFIDQFGGENRKKFLSKRFKESLLQIAHFSMIEQKENLNNIFETWKGKCDQIDDVTVLGIKI